MFMPASLVGCQTHKLFMLWCLLVCFFFLRGERRRGVCLSKAVLSRFFFLTVSFPCCEKQQSDRAGETSFFFFSFSSSTAASHSSLAKLPVVDHCGSLLPFLIVW